MYDDWDGFNVGKLLDDYEENGDFYESVNELIDEEVDRRTESLLNSIKSKLENRGILIDENKELKSRIFNLEIDYKKTHEKGFKEGYKKSESDTFKGFHVGKTVWFIQKKDTRNKCKVCNGKNEVVAIFDDKEITAKCPEENCSWGYVSTYESFAKNGRVEALRVTKRRGKMPHLSVNVYFNLNHRREDYWYDPDELYNSKEECEKDINKFNKGD